MFILFWTEQDHDGDESYDVSKEEEGAESLDGVANSLIRRRSCKTSVICYTVVSSFFLFISPYI